MTAGTAYGPKTWGFDYKPVTKLHLWAQKAATWSQIQRVSVWGNSAVAGEEMSISGAL